MPAYPWLFEREVDGAVTGRKMSALRTVGVPYTDEDIAGAEAAVAGKLEIDALIAYVQQLGTLLQTRR
jgi:cytochrome c oxidase cbb3-type subunit 2